MKLRDCKVFFFLNMINLIARSNAQFLNTSFENTRKFFFKCLELFFIGFYLRNTMGKPICKIKIFEIIIFFFNQHEK